MTQAHSARNLQKLREAAERFHNRATKYHAKGEAVRPEWLYLRALELQQTVWGPEHPEVAHTLNNLALYYKALGRLAEARPLYERALAIFRRTQGASHENTAATLYNFAQLLKAQAKQMQQRARQTEEDAREMARAGNAAESALRQGLGRYRLRAGPSRIHRFGIFTDESIPSGRKVIPYLGEFISRRECVRRKSDARTYLLRVNDYWCLDGSVGGSGAELINHSCEPNCRFRIRGRSAWVESTRKIDRGEELLIDYRFSYRHQAVPCYCGAPTCRGMINTRRPLSKISRDVLIAGDRTH
jgi:tetratricopeptide (TPR) repeat protein